ncbi:MAG: tripartite tricarboxylate transporter TctB family protein [Deltaproteobacteria bacterium]|nr:tripartite tricarboxylate transporter TctB family protein [Deltaproteobacteria bacterium]MBW2150817.1 tripartite tricarboxylate transporter TctB family protein [Deltaproteobacteria bacterium]
MIKNPGDFKLGIGFMAFCLFCLFYLIPNQVGGITEEESLLPILITLFIAVLSGSLILSSIRLEPAGSPAPTSNRVKNSKPAVIIAVIGIMIAYAWLLDVIGFLLCSFFTMIALFLAFGVRNYKKMAVIIAITLGVLYIAFEKLLMAPLPVGSLIERFMD